jgi:rSAM/selenodomain-associated transferase 2
MERPLISVIIPTLNEEDNIERCIRSVGTEETGCEIILADGGSTDRTLKRAGACEGVRIVKTGRGRGLQMNRGAAAAGGDVLLFLHADTRLEEGWRGAMLSLLDDRSVAGGAFTFKVDSDERKYRLIEFWVRLRCSFFKLPYGDQGIFVRRDIFESLGGYREIPLMEDVDLIGRIRKRGRIAILGKHAFTHQRRWEREGWVRVSLQNQLIMLLYRLGRDPDTLAKIYYRGR